MSNAVTKRNVATFLRQAALKIEKHGHIKGSYGYKEIGYCATGALGFGGSISRLGSVAANAAGDQLARELNLSVGCVHLPSFNDRESTTAKDVTSLFRRAARAIEHGAAMRGSE